MNERGWRALGFLLAMLGFGLALDAPWPGLAWLLLLAGAGAAGVGVMRPGAALSSGSAPGDNERPP